MEPLRLLAIVAHPDDESLGFGGVLAKYAAEGVETHLITATRGERGWTGDPAGYPGERRLGEIREQELRSAAAALGLASLTLLDYIDGELDEADPGVLTRRLAAELRRIRPQVVISFGPDGGYGHIDHIAISQATSAAIVEAAGLADGQQPHRVAKLYHRTWGSEETAIYTELFGELVMTFDGVARGQIVHPGWYSTARLNTASHWPTVWRAIACHRSQLPNYQRLAELPADRHAILWGKQTYYRVFSLVNGGRTVEGDLFAGLRGLEVR